MVKVNFCLKAIQPVSPTRFLGDGPLIDLEWRDQLEHVLQHLDEHITVSPSLGL